MSDFFFRTGRSRAISCERCGQEVHQDLERGAATNVEFWRTRNHSGGCGLPCFGAAVPGKAYRLGEYHRHNSDCGPLHKECPKAPRTEAW